MLAHCGGSMRNAEAKICQCHNQENTRQSANMAKAYASALSLRAPSVSFDEIMRKSSYHLSISSSKAKQTTASIYKHCLSNRKECIHERSAISVENSLRTQYPRRNRNNEKAATRAARNCGGGDDEAVLVTATARHHARSGEPNERRW